MKGNDTIYDFLDVWEDEGIEDALEEIDDKELAKVKKAIPEMATLITEIKEKLKKLEEIADKVE